MVKKDWTSDLIDDGEGKDSLIRRMRGAGTCCISATCSAGGGEECDERLETVFGARYSASRWMKLVVGRRSGKHGSERTRLLEVGICMVLEEGSRALASVRTTGALLNCIEDEVNRK